MNLSKVGEYLTPCGVLEVASVLGGIRDIARFSLRQNVVSRLVSSLDESEIVAMPQRLYTTFVRQDTDGNTYHRLSDQSNDGSDEQIVYVTRRRQCDVATTLFALERGAGSCADVGKVLGYPACCCERYNLIARGNDWLEMMLDNTPGEAATYASCNRCARIFGEWGVLPDYFPCSFCCVESQRLAEKMDAAGRSAGLSDYLDRVWMELRTPIRIDRNVVERRSRISQREQRATNCSPRLLTWI
jgi:hypothetical protein